MSGDVMMCRWNVAKDQMIGEKRLIKLALTIYRDFMQGLLYKILIGGGI